MTESAPATASSPVHVDHHTFELTGSDTRSRTGFDTSNGLVFSLPGQAVICTGISTGWVNVSVQVRRQPPPRVDADAWDEIIDHSVETPTGTLRVTSVMADAPDLPLLTPQGPGTYRIRIHARGRDTTPDGVPAESAEDYLLSVWPAAPSPDEIHKQTDRYGTELRTQPSRPSPADNAEDDLRHRTRERLHRRRIP
ncbi:hypothetical protein ACFRI7_02990 [Streptomyces sp. NPDC056716]|uniref:hypothetical protein n=1 Tax=unclassified Streptomyces TaxID=2593676 RepID=UPI0036C4D61C